MDGGPTWLDVVIACRSAQSEFKLLGDDPNKPSIGEVTEQQLVLLVLDSIRARLREKEGAIKSIPMRLVCPMCRKLHIDEGEFATKPHHTHACQHCGHVWRPAIVPTVGVRFLPGFKNEENNKP